MKTEIQLISDGHILLKRTESGSTAELKLHVSEVEAVCKLLKKGAQDYEARAAQQKDADKLVPPLRRKNAVVKLNRYFFNAGPVDKRLMW